MNRKSRILKRLRTVVVLVVVFTTVLVGCGAFTMMTRAESIGNGGPGNGAAAGTGTNDCGVQIIGNCHGGGWVYRETNQDAVTIPTNFFAGGTVTGCAEVGGFYVSSWFIAGDPNNLAGIAQNNMWTVMGGWHNYNANAVPIGTVQAAFAEAQRRGVLQPGTDWNNVGWFCSDEFGGGCDDDDPSCDPVPDTDTDKAKFYSKSRVKVRDPDITGGYEATSKRNGSVTVYFSTDKSSVEVDFEHIVGYDAKNVTLNTPYEIVDDAVTGKWRVVGGYTVDEQSTDQWAPDSSTEEVMDASRGSVTINFGDNYGTKKKCSTIKYKRKNVTLSGEEILTCDASGNCTTDHWEYSASYSGDGSSRACVVVTRPEPPSGEPVTPPNGGSPDGDIMFTGEKTPVIWKEIYAKSVDTRRLKAWQSILFQVDHVPEFGRDNIPAKVAAESNSLGRDGGAPCKMYSARFSPHLFGACKIYESGDWNTETSLDHEHTYDKTISAKVPDYVGHKYCNSFGYGLEYWYGKQIGDGDIEWHHDSAKDYWYNFGAACRTIAKKPSAAVWNGSSMTVGGIETSLAQRHRNAVFGEVEDNNKQLYGSWSEYLVVAGRRLEKSKSMASGSTISEGSELRKLDLCEGTEPWTSNSPLTIANVGCTLGESRIGRNSTFELRLEAYLRDADPAKARTEVVDISNLYGGVTGNKVVKVTGDLLINQNIKINDVAAGYSIHDVPQAVIFVNGNVNIDESVERIDAWIIARGTVNTCYISSNPGNFNIGGGADKRNVTSDGYGFEGSHCTKQLVFNGPVIASSVNLQRSFGSDPNLNVRLGTFGDASKKETPAEVFNLRADAYLWAYAQASRYNSSYSEAYSRELAPRY